ncbi:MAG: hypothetical protein NTZ16_06895 [Verrucomicrobia bacterium]|nr:hypothetical protein [Verrucomicrobiota bacterium]
MTNSTPAATPASSPLVDIREIKPPVEIPSGYEWLWWVLAALAIIVAGYLLWKWWQKRKAQAAIVPVVPAHVRAREKLRAALTLIAQPKPFCIAVSDAARAYLEERFSFHAPERTTEEFLRELSATDLLTKPQKQSLGGFLESCDLVKFAKYEPGESELRELYGSATRLVDETAETKAENRNQESGKEPRPETPDARRQTPDAK